MTPFERRTRTVQERLDTGEVIVLFPSPNLYYLTGYWETPSERHLFAFIPSSGEPGMVVPELVATAVRGATWIDDIRVWGDGDDPMTVVTDLVEDREFDLDRLLLDPQLWARFTQDLRVAFPDAAVSLAEDVLSASRVRKDGTELEAMQTAASLTDVVSNEIRSLGDTAVGMTERGLATEIEERLTTQGGVGVSFETIVGSGPNGARPHHTHGDREIRAGDPVVLDFGTRVNHYPSDQTRTVVFAGDPSQAFVDAHQAVLDAQQAGIDAVEPGVEAQAVDAAARTVLENRGYGNAFIHRTGHGVGLDVHEAPFIVEGNDRELEVGMVFSVEPGVYREGEFGVRIEDLVVVTEDGCERLNESPRGWRSPE